MLDRRRLLALAAAASGLGALPLPVRAAPAAELWERWLPHAPRSERRADHAAWDAFLARYLEQGSDGIARLAYGAVSAADRRALQSYLAALSAVPVRDLARPEQFAYWFNLYNALTVETVLAHYPVDSIRDIDISPGLFAQGPWGAELIAVEGTPLSLDDIEHRILRPVWDQDPLIHYGVNCAALGCPNLQPQAFRAETADAVLARAAGAYVNHPRGAEFRNGGLVVSSIYLWFQEDFGDSDAGVIAHLRRHARPALAQRLATAGGIFDDRYDWALNDAGRRGT